MRAVLCVSVLCLFAAVGVRVSAQKPDLQAAKTAIMKADEDFNRSVADRNKERFLALIADDATFGGGTGNEQKGKDAIRTQNSELRTQNSEPGTENEPRTRNPEPRTRYRASFCRASRSSGRPGSAFFQRSAKRWYWVRAPALSPC
jgi:hypothetical protein